MPEWIIGVAGLAVLFGVGYLWQKATSAMGKKANQAVFARRGHREGQELVTQRMEFTVHASLADVKRAILSTVKVAPNIPAVIQDAHLIRAGDDHILYGFGNKLIPHNFRGMLALESTGDVVKGSWEIINWTLADGIVVGQPVMKRLAADINTALWSIDPNARLRDSTTGRAA